MVTVDRNVTLANNIIRFFKSIIIYYGGIFEFQMKYMVLMLRFFFLSDFPSTFSMNFKVH